VGQLAGIDTTVAKYRLMRKLQPAHVAPDAQQQQGEQVQQSAQGVCGVPEQQLEEQVQQSAHGAPDILQQQEEQVQQSAQGMSDAPQQQQEEQQVHKLKQQQEAGSSVCQVELVTLSLDPEVIALLPVLAASSLQLAHASLACVRVLRTQMGTGGRVVRLSQWVAAGATHLDAVYGMGHCHTRQTLVVGFVAVNAVQH
jgi:hypothetical protein